MRGPLANVVGHGLWYALGNAIGKAGGLLLLPIFTNAAYLSTEAYGTLGVFEVTVQIAIIVGGLQLGLAVLRFHADEQVRTSSEFTAFWTLVVLLLALAVVAWALIPAVVDPAWRTISWLLFVHTAAETLLTIPLSKVRAAGRAPVYTLLLVGRLVFVLAGTFWLVVFERQGLQGVVMAYALASVATLLIAVPVASGSLLLRPSIDRALLGQMVRFSLPLVLAGIGSMALNAADRYVLIAMRTAEEVALYTLAVKFGGVVNMFAAQPLQLALFPVLFQAAEDQRAWLVASLTRISTLLFGLLTIGLVLFSEPLLAFMGADEFYWDSTGLIAWIALGFGVFGISIIFDGVLILFRKTGQTSFWFTVAAVMNILLNFAVVPYLGAKGAAITTLVSYAVLLGGRIWATRGLLAVRHRVLALVGVTAMTVIVCVIASVFELGLGLQGMSIRVGLVAVWVAVVFAARWVDPED
ncbi:MAG TPA: oligosaccharide flippase family protein, partial [Rhodothermales bacterium]